MQIETPTFRTSTLSTVATLLVTLSFVCSVTRAKEADHGLDPALYQALEWRSVGPNRGGRSAAVTGVPSQANVYYMGASGGGVWKTENAGQTWNNISDGSFKTGAVGAVAVSLSDPNVVYVGMGEAPFRNQTSTHGDGVYKSTDAGKTWVHLGLEGTRQISKIRIHPTNPEVVFVAAQGNPWGASEERGVYRSADGGKSWELILTTNNESGAVDLSMDAHNPRILYAAMWDHGRKPWFVRSGGPGGGICKTTNGGDSWQKLEDGLPSFVGKIGIAVSPANPERVYAIIEAEEGGLYRSDNGGSHWERVNGARDAYARAWYYIHIAADTVDEDTVYVLNVTLLKSIDGGKTFTSMSAPHGDHHELWIHPSNNKIMISADDGGAAVTFDRGQTWSTQDNQRTAQIYRVITDDRFPYHIYGAQQDQGALGISSHPTSGDEGFFNDFYPIGGWERAHIAFDAQDPRLIYSSTNNIGLTEFDRNTNRERPLRPYPQYTLGLDTRDHQYRASWSPPVVVSSHDSNIIYYGTNKLLRSANRGRDWAEVSPDLTRNDDSKHGKMGGPITNELDGDAYNTIFYITESPHEAGTIWVGTDDGLVHITRDGGVNWKNVTPPGVEEAFVNAIEASPHDPAKAYVAIDGHRSDDFTPSIYKTENYGRDWTKITRGLPADTFARVVREDPERPGLLYGGAEAGIFVSFNDGSDWQPLQLNLPYVPVTDITLRQGDIIISTEGRGFWILENPAPLRQLDGSLDADLHIFKPADTHRIRGRSAVVYYYLVDDPGKAAESISFEILDSSGQVVRTVRADPDSNQCQADNADIRRPFRAEDHAAEKGLNRWEWDLRRDAFPCIDNMHMFAGREGARVVPGEYRVRITLGAHSQTRSLSVVPDPREEISVAQFAEFDASLVETASILRSLITRLDRLRAARDQVAALVSLTRDRMRHDDIKASADVIVDRIADWEAEASQPKHEALEDEINYPNMLDAQLLHLLRSIDRADAPVSAGATTRLADLRAEWSALLAEYRSIADQDIAALNALLKQVEVEPVVPP